MEMGTSSKGEFIDITDDIAKIESSLVQIYLFKRPPRMVPKVGELVKC